MIPLLFENPPSLLGVLPTFVIDDIRCWEMGKQEHVAGNLETLRFISLTIFE